MSFWIFKLSEQEQYPDEFGQAYVYDNRHSVQVAAGDFFVYLDKRFGRYSFSGHGLVTKVPTEMAEVEDSSQSKIKCIYTAVLSDFFQYDPPLGFHPNRSEGKKIGKRWVSRMS